MLRSTCTPTQITALAVTKSYNGRLVLDSVTCSLAAGERTGTIGENGSGKTTLLRLLAGHERPDHGEVVVHAEGGIGHLAQDSRLPHSLTVQEVIDRALDELRAIEGRMHRLEAAMADGDESGLAEYGDLLTVFELRGGYDADARVERALHGLGLQQLRRDRVVGSLSGGERVRLRLAAVLSAGPEVLLLDEPTNHLDDNALAWPEEHLRTRRGTTVSPTTGFSSNAQPPACWRWTQTGSASSGTATVMRATSPRRRRPGSVGVRWPRDS